jgi:hypothetical protein
MRFKQSLCVSATLFLAVGWIAANETASQQIEAKSPSQSSVSKRDRAWVETRVADWQPKEEERAFDQIGWAKGLVEAERLAREHSRPIFLFTYSGANIACYRC